MQLGISGAFEDERHLAAYVMSKIGDLLKEFKRIVRRQAKERRHQLSSQEIADINQLGFGTETYEELKDKGPEFTSASVGVTAEVGADFAKTVGGSVGATGTRSTFYKDTPDGKRVKKTGSTTVETFKLFCKWPNGINAEVAVTRSIITNDANPDNNGDYLNIKLTPGSSAPLAKGFLSKVAENFPTKLSGASFKDAMESNMSDAAKTTTMEESAQEAIEANLGLEFNFVSRTAPEQGKGFFSQLKDGDYFLQYARLTMELKKGFKHDAEIPTAVPGLNVALGLALDISRTTSLKEFLSTSTLTYIQTVYDGLLNRGRRGAEQWQAYRRSHHNSIRGMFVAVADPTTAASAEVSGMDPTAVAGKVPAEVIALARQFASECRRVAGKDALETYDLSFPSHRQRFDAQLDALIPKFEAYLEVVRIQTLESDKSNWEQVATGTAEIFFNGEGSLKAQLKRLKYKKSGDKVTVPQSWREAYEEGLKTEIILTGRVTGKSKLAEIKFSLKKPENPSDKLGEVVWDKYRKYNRFPHSLALIDPEFYNYMKGIERRHEANMRLRIQEKGSVITKLEKAVEDRQKDWEKELKVRVGRLATVLLDTKLEAAEG
jgi:hypothetical protein